MTRGIIIVKDSEQEEIREKKYAEPYLADDRPIWLIGLSFDSKTRHLVDYAACRFDDFRI